MTTATKTRRPRRELTPADVTKRFPSARPSPPPCPGRGLAMLLTVNDYTLRSFNTGLCEDLLADAGYDPAAHADLVEEMAFAVDLAVALGEDRFRFGIMGSAHSKAIVRAVAQALGEAGDGA